MQKYSIPITERARLLANKIIQEKKQNFEQKVTEAQKNLVVLKQENQYIPIPIDFTQTNFLNFFNNKSPQEINVPQSNQLKVDTALAIQVKKKTESPRVPKKMIKDN